MTNNLLEWNKNLSKQGDKTKGRTPIHFASLRGEVTVMSLLNAVKSLVYQSDNDGSFPIHMAVTTRQLYVVLGLLKKCPDCAQLRDARGRTFFHIAAQQGSTVLVFLVLSLLREKPRFASIINMQDNDGNTGLHLAVLAGSLHTFLFMLWDKDVMLNLSNCEGKTALDLAQSNLSTGVTFTFGLVCNFSFFLGYTYIYIMHMIIFQRLVL
jgi:ankyrin repeat protein